MQDKQILDQIYSDKNLHPDVDVRRLENDLKNVIKGEVRFSDGDRALYATDSSNYRLVPLGLVIPKDRDDIINTVRIARQAGAPIFSRGGGTSLAGQCTNVAIVMDMTKYYYGVYDIDKEKKTVRVLPGTVLDEIRNRTQQQGLTFGPDPATHSRNTIGGMIGNNSCGVHSVMAALVGGGARTSDNLRDMEILTYDGLVMRVGATSDEELEKIISEGGRRGEIYAGLKKLRDTYADQIRKKYPDIPRRVSGYNLDDLLPEKGFNVARALAGSESTLVTILDATLDLIPFPKKKGLLILGYPDVFAAGRHVPEVMKFKPNALEGIDDKLVDFMKSREIHLDDIKLLPSGKGWLIVEFGGETKEEVDEQINNAKSALEKAGNPPSMNSYDVPELEQEIWEVREAGLGATAFVKGMKDSWPGWEDSAVHPENIGEYLKDISDLFHKYGYDPSLYGHFGQGIVHCRVDFDVVTADGLKNFHDFMEEATSLVVKYNGSLSGEHGDGQSRAEFLGKMFGPEILRAFSEFKGIWDPDNKMNPGKIVHPNPMLSDLRLGIEYNPWEGETYFQYPEDDNLFSRAVLRCVGVGLCRRHDSGTMCPSYMVLREEMHATRGRAHLLFEMTLGRTIKDGWRDKHVKDALDLCLACKGCKGDCPVKVDLATYKAEFLAHYYKNRIKPIHAYVFGLISRWSRLASAMPGLANWMMHAGGISSIVKKIVGIAPERDMPRFAKEPFKTWFFKNVKNNPPENKRLIFWADTFNNYFHTDVAKAAVQVLIDAGWHVIVPKKHLCCGRPLYDYGMLKTAKKWLQEILDELREEIRIGTPIIGIEPSCISTFKEELINFFPEDEDAKRLKNQTYMFSDFFEHMAPEYKLPEIKQKLIVHGHCHHKSIMKMDTEEALLKKMKADYRLLDDGCCGMAGAFGFEKDKYDLSLQIGERVLLKEVRNAKDDELIIADGFSCKEQIRQTTNRKALHIAELVNMVINENKAKAKK